MCCCGVFIMPHEATEPCTRVRREPKPITGRFVLFTCTAFFGVIFAVNATMMTLAIRTMPGLDVKNGYVASQAMNGEIEAMRRQDERGWSAEVEVRLVNGLAPVHVRLTARDGRPVSGLDVRARLAHPALTRADHSADLREVQPGVYAAEIADASAGAWTLVVEARRDGERVFASRNRAVLMERRS
jgi:nitrogen fixation protein FixH